jgi:hypothetical protein
VDRRVGLAEQADDRLAVVRSTTAGVAPRAAMASAWVSSRTSATTSWPCSCSSVSTCDPMNPVAPVSATLVVDELMLVLQ